MPNASALKVILILQLQLYLFASNAIIAVKDAQVQLRMTVICVSLPLKGRKTHLAACAIQDTTIMEYLSVMHVIIVVINVKIQELNVLNVKYQIIELPIRMDRINVLARIGFMKTMFKFVLRAIIHV